MSRFLAGSDLAAVGGMTHAWGPTLLDRYHEVNGTLAGKWLLPDREELWCMPGGGELSQRRLPAQDEGVTAHRPPLDEVLPHLWRFVRGDTPVVEFERWAYQAAGLEDLLGKTLYMDLISTGFDDAEEVGRIRARLRTFAEGASELTCRCVTVADLDVIDMGEHDGFFATLDERRQRGKPWWWLRLEVCRVCGQGWLVAQEERQNDVFCLRRLDAETVARVIEEAVWPPDFDRYETLLRLGRDAGRSVTFLDPLGDSSLESTIADLAIERPGILLSELCGLLNLDRGTAEAIARKVVAERHVAITFDGAGGAAARFRAR